MPLLTNASKPWRPALPWLAAITAYTALACALLRPLLREAGRLVVDPGDDALLNSWILWWNVQVLPLTDAWWNAPIFYPARGSLAFSEVLLGELPLTAPVQWLTANPILAHNVAVFLSFPLCAFSAHALVFHLTRRHDAAALAGIAFGFGAFRANHMGHLQLLSVYWTPVVLLCLHRSLAPPRWTPRLAWLGGAAAACTMQVLCNGYALFQLPLLVAAWGLWFPRTLTARAAVLASLAAAGLALAPVLLGYREIHDHYGLVRPYDSIRDLSADIVTLFQAHPGNMVLGGVVPASGPAWFPGVTMVAVLVAGSVMAFRYRAAVARGTRLRLLLPAMAAAAAVAAAAWAVLGDWAIGPLTVSGLHKPISVVLVLLAVFGATGPRARRLWQSRSATGFYALSAALFFALSFGPEPRLLGTPVFYKSPYWLLLRLPGYDSVRAPDRMALLATLCLVVVMALTYARWAPARLVWRRAACGVLAAGLVLDGWFGFAVQKAPLPGPSLDRHDARAVIELPLLLESDVSAMYRTIEYGLPSINASSGYWPPHYHVLRDALGEGDLTVLEGLDVDGQLAAVIARASPEHDRFAQTVAGMPGAAMLERSDAWSAYRVPMPGTEMPALGEPLPVARIVEQGEGNDLHEVVAELADTADMSAVRIRLDRVWPFFASEIAIETSVDGVAWTMVWQGRTSAGVVRGLLHEPRRPPFVVAFEPTSGRFLRVRRTDPEEGRTLTTDGFSVH